MQIFCLLGAFGSMCMLGVSSKLACTSRTCASERFSYEKQPACACSGLPCACAHSHCPCSSRIGSSSIPYFLHYIPHSFYDAVCSSGCDTYSKQTSSIFATTSFKWAIGGTSLSCWIINIFVEKANIIKWESLWFLFQIKTVQVLY